MVSSIRIESLSERFAPYVEELQDFFRSRRVPYGNPADLNPFVDRLADPAFHEEMVSMVRSVLYREDEAISRSDLAELIGVAVGGAQMDDLGEALGAPLRRILAFVGDVFRSLRVSFFAEPEPDSLGSAELQPHPAPLAEAPSLYPEDLSERPLAASSPLRATAPAAAPSTNDRLAFALMASAAEQSAEASAIHMAAPASHVERSSTTTVPTFAPSPTFMSVLRRSYWIPGVFALALAVLAVLFVSGYLTFPRSSTPAPLPAAQEAQTPVGRIGRHLPFEGVPHRNSPAAPGATISNPALVTPANARPGSPVPQRAASSTPPQARIRPERSALATRTLSPKAGLTSSEGVFLASSGVMASHLLSAPAPGYPTLAKLTHVEGQVIVQVVVARNGTVAATRILDGPHLLRSSAEHAIRHWRYRPFLVDGRPTDVATLVTVTFRIPH